MNAYLKGAIGALVIIGAITYWYRANVATLIVNRPPASYQLISEMESKGVPDFSLERMDGTPFKMSENEGQITIVNFWASWCNPCVEEFPSMLKLVEHFGGKLRVVAVSTDDDKKDILAFLKAFGLPKPGFEVVWDKNKDVMKRYGIEKVPESFLIAKDGKLIRKVLGIENWISNGAVEYFQQMIDGPVDITKIPGHGATQAGAGDDEKAQAETDRAGAETDRRVGTGAIKASHGAADARAGAEKAEAGANEAGH